MAKAKNANKSLEQWGEEKAAAKFEEHQPLVRDNRVLRSRVEAQEKQLVDLQKRLGLYEELYAAKAAPPAWMAPPKPSKHHTAIPCMMLTDIHWDEVIKPEQVDGVNAYNRPIALQRLQRAFSRAIHVTRDYISGVDYTGFQLFLGGDLLSGIIHEELRETNNATVIESILSVVEPLEAGIKLLRETYGQLNISAVVGNHGRRTQRPVAKNRPQDNFDWLVYKMLQRELRGMKGLSMHVADSSDALVQVHSMRYLLTHGDQFRGGSGISAALAPLLLGTHRKTRRQAAAGRPYDIMVLGHFHTSIWMPTKGLIVGGSIVGYNEFAYQQNMEPEPPQCALWLNTPERGITVSAPIYVAKREEEGW